MKRHAHSAQRQSATMSPRPRVRVRGFAFVELLVAMALFIVACVATLAAYLGGNLLVENARQANLAWNHLTSVMEGIHATPFTALLTTFPHQVADGGGAKPYASLVGGTAGIYPLPGEQITVCYPNALGSCAAAPPVATKYEVRTTLTWTQRGRARTLSLSTMKVSS